MEQSSHLGPLGELGTVRTRNQEEAEVIYFERLNLISCLSSKEASFVKGMHAPEERTPIRQCRNNRRPSVHSLPLDQGGKGTPSMLSRESLLELPKLHAFGFLSEAAVQQSTVPLLCFCYKLTFVWQGASTRNRKVRTQQSRVDPHPLLFLLPPKFPSFLKVWKWVPLHPP